MILIPHSYPDLDMQDHAALKEYFDRAFVGWDHDLDEVLRGEIRKFVSKKEVVLTPSGSMSLLVALRALGVQAGDSVLIPAINCWSVYNAITFLGAKPVICDVRSPVDLRSCFENIAQKMSPEVKVVVVTHMFGVLIEEETIRRLKKELKLHVIEDYASSFGALYDNRLPVGRFSDLVIGSFGSTKALTGGMGGFVAGNDIFLKEGHNGPVKDLISLNCQISCLNQKLLERQFSRLDKMLEQKKRLKDFYLKHVKLFGAESDGLYRAITFDDTGKLMGFLNKEGIQLDIRESAQPNLAQVFNLDLLNARDFKAYKSLPFHTKLAQEMERKGLL